MFASINIGMWLRLCMSYRLPTYHESLQYKFKSIGMVANAGRPDDIAAGRSRERGLRSFDSPGSRFDDEPVFLQGAQFYA
jgi:hypothetical protein